MRLDLPCTSKLNVKSRVMKPLAVGLLEWKFMSPAHVTMRLIYLKNSTFLSVKITVDTLIDVRNETSKHCLLKSVQINTLTLLSYANIPVRFGAQQRLAKCSSLSLTANCIAAKRCL